MRLANLVAAGLLLAGSAVPASAAPADALRAGDVQQMIAEIVAVYEGAGLSWDHGIDWKPGPFTTTYWYYDTSEDEIIMGAMPTDAQLDVYWQTWSQVLTDGNFDPAAFFASAEEARDLARYNQYVLATHESAHAMTYRYDYDHLKRHDWAINCREYYADRLTVAILNEQALDDPDMARWRDRYHELVVAMGDSIPAQYRYHIPDFATLDADCAVIDVAQPTPDAMQPYASAYFERYRVLLEADLPPLAEVFEKHLVSYHEAQLARLPLDEERGRYEIVTRDTPNEPAAGARPDDNGTSYSRAPAFGPDGTLYFATLGYDHETRMAQFEFGTNPGVNPVLGPPTEWQRPANRLEITSLAVLSADRFVAALTHWQDVDGDETAQINVVTWVLATRANGAWTLELMTEIEDMARAAVLRHPAGGIFLLATPETAATVSNSQRWVALEVDIETGDVLRELPVPSGFRQPYAIDAEDRVYEVVVDVIWRSTTEGRDTVFAGVRLQGLRDGPLTSAELVYPDAIQWFPDGTALVLDSTPGYGGSIIREIRPIK